MNRNDTFKAKKVCWTELQHRKNPLKKTFKIYMGRISDHQQMLDLKTSSFIRCDDNEAAAKLFSFGS
jgi:hypothetical protein